MGVASVVPVRKQKTGVESLVKNFKKKVEGRFNTEKKRKESITNVCDLIFVFLCARSRINICNSRLYLGV